MNGHDACDGWIGGVVMNIYALQTGLSEEPVQQEKEAGGSGGVGTWEVVVGGERKKQQQQLQRRKKGKSRVMGSGEDSMNINEEEKEGGEEEEERGGSERQREHPFIVTEPGEVARGKKNGLDYLFHLYEQCRDFLIQVQNIAKERGEKCPTKVFLLFSSSFFKAFGNPPTPSLFI